MMGDEIQPDIVAMINEYVGDYDKPPEFQRMMELGLALRVLLSPEQYERLGRESARMSDQRHENEFRARLHRAAAPSASGDDSEVT